LLISRNEQRQPHTTFSRILEKQDKREIGL
jgi:hypothetical protein